jgi:hypothetical protein
MFRRRGNNEAITLVDKEDEACQTYDDSYQSQCIHRGSPFLILRLLSFAHGTVLVHAHVHIRCTPWVCHVEGQGREG